MLKVLYFWPLKTPYYLTYGLSKVLCRWRAVQWTCLLLKLITNYCSVKNYYKMISEPSCSLIWGARPFVQISNWSPVNSNSFCITCFKKCLYITIHYRKSATITLKILLLIFMFRRASMTCAIFIIGSIRVHLNTFTYNPWTFQASILIEFERFALTKSPKKITNKIPKFSIFRPGNDVISSLFNNLE